MMRRGPPQKQAADASVTFFIFLSKVSVDSI